MATLEDGTRKRSAPDSRENVGGFRFKRKARSSVNKLCGLSETVIKYEHPPEKTDHPIAVTKQIESSGPDAFDTRLPLHEKTVVNEDVSQSEKEATAVLACSQVEHCMEPAQLDDHSTIEESHQSADLCDSAANDEERGGNLHKELSLVKSKSLSESSYSVSLQVSLKMRRARKAKIVKIPTPPAHLTRVLIFKLCEDIFTSEYDLLYEALTKLSDSESNTHELLQLVDEVVSRYMKGVEQLDWKNQTEKYIIDPKTEQYVLQTKEIDKEIHRLQREMQWWDEMKAFELEVRNGSFGFLDSEKLLSGVTEEIFNKPECDLILGSCCKELADSLQLVYDVLGRSVRRGSKKLSACKLEHSHVLRALSRNAFGGFVDVDRPKQLLKALL